MERWDKALCIIVQEPSQVCLYTFFNDTDEQVVSLQEI
jgi:hypothetical protein